MKKKVKLSDLPLSENTDIIVTVKRDFVYKAQNKRYHEGDIIEIPKSEFERINYKRRTILIEGKHNLGKGICYPCQKSKSK